jgi:hypothetical protein
VKNNNKIIIKGKYMKTLIIIAFLLLTVAAKSQSVLTLGSDASMGVLTGANLCVDVINGAGFLYGGGFICGGLVGIEPVFANELPTSFDMLQNYPNPFNPSTLLRYQLPKAGLVTVMLYDGIGREVRVLQAGRQQAGYYQLTIDGTNLASGLYFCRITASGFTKTIKMLMVK